MKLHRAILSALCAGALLCFAAGCGKDEPPAAEGQAAGGEDLEAASWRSRYETLVEQNEAVYKEREELEAGNQALNAQVEALQQKLKERDENEEALAERDRLKGQLEEKDSTIKKLLKEMKRADLERSAAAADGNQARKVRAELQGLATEALQERRWDLARRLLTSAVELGANDPQVFFTVAYCCGNLGDDNAAAEWYEKVIGQSDITQPAESLHPVVSGDLLPKLYNNYAATLVKLDRKDEALEWYQKSVQADEEYPAVYYNLGRLYEEHLGQPENAVEAYRRHIALGGSRSAEAAEHILKLESRE